MLGGSWLQGWPETGLWIPSVSLNCYLSFLFLFVSLIHSLIWAFSKSWKYCPLVDPRLSVKSPSFLQELFLLQLKTFIRGTHIFHSHYTPCLNSKVSKVRAKEIFGQRLSRFTIDRTPKHSPIEEKVNTEYQCDCRSNSEQN